MRLTTALYLVIAALCPLHLPAAVDSGEQPISPPEYYELKPSLVANLHSGARYIRFDIQLMTQQKEHLDKLQHHAPALRHELFLLMSDQDGAALKEPKGKEKFRKASLKALQKVMKELEGEEMPDDLFFTTFLVR
ncbi:MAG: flagellar basal body-associated FliL family protein [Gammaproteobacteria bacterium]|nr:flagellar basal body-associated FliL family protein [Gammaproteobacteria bacterium]